MRDEFATTDNSWQDTLNWSGWNTYNNKQGERRARRQVEPNKAFWDAWNSDKESVKREGAVSLRKARNGKWQLTQWADVDHNGLIIAPGGPQESQDRNSGGYGHHTTQRRSMTQEAPQMNQAPPQMSEQVCERVEQPQADVDPVVPAGKKLMAHQYEDVRRCVAMGNVLLANPMGLGKTIVAAVTAGTVGAKRILIVCPKALQLNWEHELGEWLVGGADCLVVTGKNYESIHDHDGPVIATYDLAAKDYVREYLDEIWEVVIFDEAQAFNNHESKRTENLIGPHGITAERKLLLSGTPFKNRPIELWPLIRYLDPQRWGSRHEYGMRYCAAKFDHLNNAWDYRGSSNLSELNSILHSTVMIRRDKSEQELPPLQHDMIVLPPTDEQEDLVQREHALNKAMQSGNVHANDLADMMGGDDVTIEGAMATVRKNLAMSKVDAAINHVERLVTHGEPVVVLVHHRECGDELEQHFGGRCVRIVGGLSAKKSRKIVEAFQSKNGPPVCIVSIRAGGAGITLTRSRVMVAVECDWSPGVMDQAYGRTWRIGQDRDVHVQHLVVDGSLDKILYGVIRRKGMASAEAFAS